MTAEYRLHGMMALGFRCFILGQVGAAMQDKDSWSGRFAEPVAELVKHYTASVGFDRKLAMFDIQGSLAHAQMLAACGIIATNDLNDKIGRASCRERV